MTNLDPPAFAFGDLPDLPSTTRRQAGANGGQALEIQALGID